MRTMRWLAVAVLVSAAAPAGADAMEPRQVKPGFRDVAIPVERHQAGALKPGERVDVLVTFEAEMANKAKERVTATLLQNVEVLAVYTHDKEGKAQWIVRLALNPTEAQYVVLAMGPEAQVWLVRRAPGDDATKGLEMAAFRKLFR